MNLKVISGRIRLLPTVFAAGAAVLTLKGAGLVHDARAQEKPSVQTASIPPTTPPAQHDIASDDNDTSSSAEVDVLTSLSARRAELDARARQQEMRENVLAATEQRIDAKIATLKALQGQITSLLGQRDAAEEKQVASLVKTYSAMKPKDAARIFDGLDDAVLIPVAQSMKSDALAPVLAAMTPANAQKLTVKLASRLKLPAQPETPTQAVAATVAPQGAEQQATTADKSAGPQASPAPAGNAPVSAPQAATAQPDPTAKHG